MAQDPSERPDAWKVYEYLTRALHLATPPVMQLPATSNHLRCLMPEILAPRPSNAPPHDSQGHQSICPLNRRSKFSGRTYPRPLFSASSARREEISRRSSRGLTLSTIKGSQKILTTVINSLISQANTPVNRTDRLSTPTTEVLSYIRRKKAHPGTTLPGVEWLKRLHGRDQVGKHERVAFDNPVDHILLDLTRQ
jgi:hypothetical protein